MLPWLMKYENSLNMDDDDSIFFIFGYVLCVLLSTALCCTNTIVLSSVSEKVGKCQHYKCNNYHNESKNWST